MYESEFKVTLNNNPILLKHKDLLRSLSDDRIMCVGHDLTNGFYIEECCDEWFWRVLTKSDCLELSGLFKEIADTFDT